jgi:hypothetical protein
LVKKGFTASLAHPQDREDLMQAAAVIAAFNLVCQADFTADHLRRQIPTQTITYRVDPMLGRFCWDACASTQPIAAFSAGEIVFALENGDFAGPYHTVIRIQLPSGAYSHTDIRADRPDLIMTGRCERTRFSAFPAGSLTNARPLIVRVPAVYDEVTPAAMPR